MQTVTPEVFHVAATSLMEGDLELYLGEVGAQGFTTDAESDAEYLVEFAGRLCYRSFVPGLNANVTKVREGNADYLKNILTSKHGSVLEHATDTYILHNVSRVLTHEIVRHRAGCAYSQESLRYVRLTDIGAWFPATFQAHAKSEELRIRFRTAMAFLEETQRTISDLVGMDGLPFAEKKKLTSAARRLAPMGLATTIMVTANHRAWRHLVELRTSRHAEEEIRMVFGMIFEQQRETYKAIYQDAETAIVDGYLEVTFANSKV